MKWFRRSLTPLCSLITLSVALAWPGAARATTVCANTPCLGQDLHLQAAGVTSATFLWKSFTDSAQSLVRNADGTFGNPAFRHPNRFTSALQNPFFSQSPSVGRLPQLSDEGWYAVTVTANGLSSPGVVHVRIRPNPDAGADTSVCAGSTVQLHASSVVAGSTFRWTGPCAFTSTLQNPTVTNIQPACAGLYIVAVTPPLNSLYLSNPSCDTTACRDTVQVTVKDVPTVSIAGPDPVCSGTTGLVYTATVLPPGGLVTYAWTISGNGSIAGSTTDESVTVNADGAGTFTLACAVTRDGCPGSAPATKTVTVSPAPTCSIAGPDPVCTGQSGLIYSATVSPGGGVVTYAWTISGNGSIVGSTTGSSVSVTADGAGSFTLNLGVTRDGCPGATPTCSKTVTVSPGPSVTITGPDPVCTGATGLTYNAVVTPSGVSTTYQWTITGNGSIVGSATGSSVTVNADGAGSFTLGVSVTQGSCPAPATASKTVTVSPAPTCSIAGPDPVCTGQTGLTYSATVSPTGGTVTYAWTISGNGTIVGSSTGSSVSVNADGAGTFTLSLRVTRDGCPGATPTCSKTVTVSPGPSVTITGPDPVCSGQAGLTYNAVVTPSGVTTTYAWTITGNGSIVGSTTGPSVSVTADGAGTFTLAVSVTQGSCPAPATASKVVTVSPAPTCAIAGPDPVCTGQSGLTYSATVSPTGGTVTYSWTITGNGSIVGSTTGSSVSVTADGAGTFTLALSVTRDGCPGASPSCTKTVTVSPAPTATITGPDPVCTGQSGLTYNATVSPSGGAVTYAWSISGNGSIVGSTTGSSVSVTADGAGTFTLSLSFTRDGCPGAAPATKTVTVNPTPTCSITGPDPVCSGQSGLTYNATVSPTGGAVTYSWSITGNGSIIGSTTASSVSVTADGAGTFTLALAVTRDGCPGASPSCTKTVTVSPAPTATITGPDPVCTGQSGLTYNATVSPSGGAVTYAWSISGNGSIVGSTTGSSVSVTADGAGTFTLSLSFTRDGCPGAAPATKTVTVNPAPTCSITGPDPVCTGQSGISYSATVSPSGGAVTYSWSITGNGSIVGSSTSPTVTVNADGAGTFTLSLFVTRDGCPGASPACTKTVTVSPAPTATITGPDPVCSGQSGLTYNATVSPSGGAVTYAWSISGNGSIVGSATGASVTVNADGAGSFTLSLAVTRDGCPGAAPATKTVTVNPTPTCSISGPDPVCSNQSGLTYSATVSPSGGAVTYSWSITGNGSIIGSTTSSSVSVTADGAGSLTLALSVTRDGCPGASPSCTKTVTVSPAPTATITGPDPVCTGQSGLTYNATVSPSGGAVTYAWSISGNGSIVGSTTGSSVSVTADGAGTFTLSLSFTRDGCPGAAPATKTVTVNPAPSCSITGPDPVCSNQSGISYSATVSPTGGVVTYAWTVFGNATIVGAANGSSVTVNADGAGTFTLSLFVTRDGCPGASPSCTKTVTVSPAPTATITGPDPVCSGQSGLTYNATVSPSGGAVTYAWSISGNGSIVGSTTGSSVSVTADGTGTFTLSLSFTRDGCPGAAPATKTVTVNPAPTCSITGPDPVCTGQSGIGYSATVSPSGGAVTYSWSITGNGSIVGSSTSPTVTVNADGAGTFTLALSVTRDGCPGASPACTKTVTVSPAPTATITGPDPVCTNQQGVLYTATVSPSGGVVTYAWSINGNGTIVGPSNGPTVTVNVGVPGSFTLSLIVTRDGCPAAPVIKVVTVNPAPTCSITGPDPVCTNQSGITYTATVSPSGGVVTYAWTITGNGTIVGPANGPSVTVNANGPGTFTLSLVVTRDGCPGASPSCTKTVTVTPAPTATITGPDPVCTNTGGLIYTATVSPSGGAVTYAWSITGNGAIKSSTTGPTVTVYADGGGSFTLSLTVTRDGCPGATVTKTVTVNPTPVCTIIGPDVACSNQQGIIFSSTVTPSGGTVTYEWSITGNGTIVGPTNGPTVTVSAGVPGAFIIALSVTRDGCSGGNPSCTKKVPVNPAPTCTIIGPDPVCENQQGILYSATVSPSGGVVTYAWSISGNGTIVGPTNGPSVRVNADGAGSFTLSLTITRDGCPGGTCTKTVTVSPRPTVTITGPDPVCTNTGGLTYSATVSPSGGLVTYAWSITGNGAIKGPTNGPTVTVYADGGGSFTLSVSVTRDGCPGTAPATKTVTVNPTPICSISGPDVACAGQRGIVFTSTVTPSGGTVTYAWSISGDGTIAGPADGPSVTVNAGDGGAFIIALSVTRDGCSGGNPSCTKKVPVNPAPTCAINGPDPVCTNQQGLVYAATVSPSGGAISFAWSITGNGTIVGPTNGSSVTVSADGPGSFTLALAIVREGCPGGTPSCTKTVRVNAAPTVVIDGPDPVCSGRTGLTYTATVTPSGGTVSYAWTISGNGTIAGSTTGSSITVNADGPGSFTVSVSVNAGSCPAAAASKRVTVTPAPTCTISGPDPVCSGASGLVYTATVSPSGASVTYAWSISGDGRIEGSSTGSSVTVDADGPGSFTLSLDVSADGCHGASPSCSKRVTVSAPPPCAITSSLSGICSGGTADLCGPDAPGLDYKWSPGGATTRCISVSVSGTYSLTVTDRATGCKNSCSIEVSVGAPPPCAISGPSTLFHGTKGELCGPEGSGLSYHWSTGETTRCVSVGPGSYSLTVTASNGCTSSCSHTITEIPCACDVGYPDSSNPPRSQVTFGAQLALKLVVPKDCTQDSLLRLYYNSDNALVLGVRRVVVKTSSGSKTTDYPVSPNPSSPACVRLPQVGTTDASGDQAGTDKNARPLYPALFVTDVTDHPDSRSGDWQQSGGSGIPPTKVCGRWKSVVRTVDKTSSPAKVTITVDANPSKNDWNLGSEADVPPGGFDKLPTLGYGAEVAWNIYQLGLTPGHIYRLYFIITKGKSTPDAAQGCITVQIPPSVVAAAIQRAPDVPKGALRPESPEDVEAQPSATALGPGTAPSLPGRFELLQNVPNPFNRSTTIQYALPERSQVSIKVFTILGQEVASLVDGTIEPGVRSITWEAVDRSRRTLPPGMYLVRMQANAIRSGEYHQVRRMFLIR